MVMNQWYVLYAFVCSYGIWYLVSIMTFYNLTINIANLFPFISITSLWRQQANIYILYMTL